MKLPGVVQVCLDCLKGNLPSAEWKKRLQFVVICGMLYAVIVGWYTYILNIGAKCQKEAKRRRKIAQIC